MTNVLKVTDSIRKGHLITLPGHPDPIRVHPIDNDVYGKPRYVVHFSSLNINLQDYGCIPGLTKYRAKWFGGGYVFTSLNLEQTLQQALATVEAYYKEKEEK